MGIQVVVAYAVALSLPVWLAVEEITRRSGHVQAFFARLRGRIAGGLGEAPARFRHRQAA